MAQCNRVQEPEVVSTVWFRSFYHDEKAMLFPAPAYFALYFTRCIAYAKTDSETRKDFTGGARSWTCEWYLPVWGQLFKKQNHTISRIEQSVNMEHTKCQNSQAI